MRNLSCPFYQECLDKAAKQGLDDFSCSGCVHIREKTQISADDFWRCCLLFAKIYKPKIYREYVETIETV